MLAEMLKKRREENMLRMSERAAKANPEVINFDYIDAAVVNRVKEDDTPRENERERAKNVSREIIAGFPVYDPQMEREMLDSLIAKRNKSIKTFIDDRLVVVEKLRAIDIKVLAVVPRLAWANICHRAGLVVMSPDKQGNVTISREALVRFGSLKAAEDAAKRDHAAYVRALFPQTMQAGAYAKVVLPNPPEDVAAILLKAKSLKLNVAAVPEAIRFVQSPTELYDNATIDPKDEWARRQGYADYRDWVKRDPIVFHDHGTASAIIAQFGDFPIEKAVVDMVMAGNDLIPESPTSMPMTSSFFDARNDGVDTTYQRMTYEQQRMLAEQQRYAGLGGQIATTQFSAGGIGWINPHSNG